MSFNKLPLVILLFTVMLFSCDKDDSNKDFQTSAIITGPDLGQCICCGGYFIEIGDSIYNFNTVPSASDINLANETFPVAVQLDWEYDHKCGHNQYIKITRIEKQ